MRNPEQQRKYNSNLPGSCRGEWDDTRAPEGDSGDTGRDDGGMIQNNTISINVRPKNARAEPTSCGPRVLEALRNQLVSKSKPPHSWGIFGPPSLWHAASAASMDTALRFGDMVAFAWDCSAACGPFMSFEGTSDNGVLRDVGGALALNFGGECVDTVRASLYVAAAYFGWLASLRR